MAPWYFRLSLILVVLLLEFQFFESIGSSVQPRSEPSLRMALTPGILRGETDFVRSGAHSSPIIGRNKHRPLSRRTPSSKKELPSPLKKKAA